MGELNGCDFDFKNMRCNDIYAILQTFGVESARAAIISEIHSVFDVYHIGVDYHHLSLVADFMTQDGGFRPLNRGGVSVTPHILLKSSFETSSAFVIEAALQGETDFMRTSSAKITTGEAIKIGTGFFDLGWEL